MALIIVRYHPRPTVNEIVAIAVSAVRQVDGYAPADGTIIAMGSILHPTKSDIVCLFVRNLLRLSSKTSTPHLGKYIEVATNVLAHHAFGLHDVLVRLCPMDICL
jgi:hypothetical protein